MQYEKRSSFGWPATPAGYAGCFNGLVAHYDGSNQGLANKDHSSCRTYWKNTRNFHMNSNDWMDIGYSFGACPHGIILEGRGPQRVQAAQPGGNETWHSCTFMSGPNETPTSAQLNAWSELLYWLNDQYATKIAVAGHRDFISTSCPGNTIYAMTNDGTLTQPPGTVTMEDTLQIQCSLSMSGPMEFPAGARKDLLMDGKEFEDPAEIHDPTGHGVHIKTTGWYHFQVSGVLSNLPEGTCVKVALARFNSDVEYLNDPVSTIVWGTDLDSQPFSVHFLEKLFKDERYRGALVNYSDAILTVEKAYLKVAK
jgi:N-acetylmuramoyl-L-alanine amidase